MRITSRQSLTARVETQRAFAPVACSYINDRSSVRLRLYERQTGQTQLIVAGIPVSQVATTQGLTKLILELRNELDESVIARCELAAFIRKYIKSGDDKAVLYELANGRIRPSNALADSLSGLLKGNPEFILIHDQKEVCKASAAAVKAVSPTQPRVAIVEGGPGTGKTVLPINLLVHLTAHWLVGKYVSKNAAPRKVYETKLVGAISTLDRLTRPYTPGSSGIGAVPNRTNQ